MGRGDVGQTAITQLCQFSAVDALAIHRHPMQLRTCHGERMTGRPIPGIFNRYPITGLHQQLCTKADSLLRATGDHNLFSRALHATGTA